MVWLRVQTGKNAVTITMSHALNSVRTLRFIGYPAGQTIFQRFFSMSKNVEILTSKRCRASKFQRRIDIEISTSNFYYEFQRIFEVEIEFRQRTFLMNNFNAVSTSEKTKFRLFDLMQLVEISTSKMALKTVRKVVKRL